MDGSLKNLARPALWGFFVSLAFVALLFLYHWVWSAYITGHWEEERAKQEQEIARSVQSAFRLRIDELLQIAVRAKNDSGLIRQLKENSVTSVASAFRQLEKVQAGRDITLEVVDPRGTVVAWSGHNILDNYGSVFQGSVKDSFVIITQSGLLTALTVGLSDGGGTFYVLASRALEFNYPISNRFTSKSSFTGEMAEEIGSSLYLTINAKPAIDTHRAIPLADLRGDPIAFVSAVKPSLEVSLQGLSNDVERASSLVLSLGVFLLFLFVYHKIQALRSPWLLLLAKSIAIWLVRYAWRLAGFPSLLVGGPLFDPSVYASPFGLGLTSSAGELLLSVIALTFNTWIGVRQFLVFSAKQRNAEDTRTRKSIVTIAGIIALAVLILAVTRAYAAAIRSFVFDSTIQFHNPTVVVPDLIVVFMHTNVLLISFSFIGIVMMLFGSMWFFSYKLRSRYDTARWGLILLVFLFCVPLFRLLEGTPVVPSYYPLLVVLVGIFLTRWVVADRGHTSIGADQPWRFALWVVLASFVISSPLLDAKLHEKERERIEVYASELLRPVDDWLSFILLDGLRSATAEMSATADSSGSTSGSMQNFAFALWAHTFMSKQGYNSAAILYDRNGREIDRFAVGLSGFEQRELLLKLFDGDEESVQVIDRTVGRGRIKFYGVWSTVRDGNGRLIGSVALLLAASQRHLFRGESPEPLRSFNAGGFEGDFREITISEYSNGARVSQENDQWSSRSPLPADVQYELTTNEHHRVWRENTSPEGDFETLYLSESNGSGRVISIGLEELDLRWHLFNLVKVFFVYAVIVTLAAFIRLAVVRARGIAPAFSFRSKLFLAFAVISVVPLVLLGYYNRRVAAERLEQNISETLSRDLNLVQERIVTYVSDEEDFIQGVNDDFCESLAAEYGVDFSVFRRNSLQASSRPELYHASLLDTRLPAIPYIQSALLGKDFFVNTEKIGTVEYAVGYKPIRLNSRFVGVLAVPMLYRQREIEQDLAQRNAFILGAYALVFGLTVVAGGFLANRFARPLSDLTKATRSIGRGNLDVELTPRSSDEIGELVKSFNEMAKELKRSRNELARVERELAWKEMAKQVAHEIKNPLTPMKLSIQHLRQAFQDRAEDRETILHRVTQTIIEQIEVLTRIATEFSNFARMPERRFERVDVQALLRDSIALFKEVKEIEFRTKFSDTDVHIVADRDELGRVFLNILRNSVQAIEGKGAITVDTIVVDRRYRIRISDTGSGIPEEMKERVFEPNFSTKTDGMGLGLAIVQKVIEDLGGTISFESKAGKGTTFEINLPV